MIKIEDIIYNTTRGIYSVDDKLRIATIFIFCYSLEAELFSELLYTNDHEKLIEKLRHRFSAYNVDFNIRFEDKVVNNSFFKTLGKVQETYDKEGFYKSIYEGDKYAIAITEIVNNDCNELYKKVKILTNQFKMKI